MDLHWNGDEVKFYDAIKVIADHNRIDLPSFVKKLIAAKAKQ